MPSLLSLYFTSPLMGPALAAVIVIGVTVRVCLMAQPGTRFHSYWRSLFKTPHPQKNTD